MAIDRDAPVAQPETAAALDHLKAVAWASADPVLLERCARQVASLLGDGNPEELDDGLGGREGASLAFTEQFVFSVASVSDDDVEALLAHAEPLEVYRFVCALYALEMSHRIETVGRVVLGAEEEIA